MMKEKSVSAMRDALGDMFGIMEYKARSGAMSADDMRSILTSLEAGGGIRATVSDLAAFYNRSEADVRNVIHRNLMPKPIRRVTYDFGAFRRVVPASWKRVSEHRGTD